ncbi:DUF1648 domain-containing protein [Streptosporangium jomthongense]|uniref:DUF1648 domain-containing protein n=1 Tax=Streptosporangium jomthongense TaxID=1193683 RepID=A0ABV8EWM3_9ACTN
MDESHGSRSILWKLALLTCGPLLTTALSVWAFSQVPADAVVPVHWNAIGEADRYVSRLEALLTLPIVSIVVSLVAWLVDMLGGVQRNVVPGWVLISLMLVTAHGFVLQAALSGRAVLPRVIVGVLGLAVLTLAGRPSVPARWRWAAALLGCAVLVAAFAVPL